MLACGVDDMDENQERLIRIDEGVCYLKKEVKELKEETAKRLDAHAAKLSAHNVNFGKVDVRLAQQDNRIATGKFWKTLIVIVLGLMAVSAGLVAVIQALGES